MTHPDLEELLGAYALDATEPAERQKVEAHLEECPRCRAEVAAHQEAAALLANVLGEAPAGLWAKVAGSLAQFELVAAPRPGPPLGEELAPLILKRGAEHAKRLVVRGAAASLAAAVAALIGAEVAALRSETGRLRQEMSMAAAATETGAGPHRTLRLTPSDRSPVATIIVAPNGDAYWIWSSMKALPSSQTYQLWGLSHTTPVPLALVGPTPGRWPGLDLARRHRGHGDGRTERGLSLSPPLPYWHRRSFPALASQFEVGWPETLPRALSDQGQRPTEAAVGRFEGRRRRPGITTAGGHHAGELGVPAGHLEGFDGPLGAHSGDGFDDADGPVPQLGVGGPNVDHEIAIGLAQEDHDRGRDRVQRDLLSRPGVSRLEPATTSPPTTTSTPTSVAAASGVPRLHASPTVAARQRGPLDGTEDVGGATAGRDANDHVGLVNAQVLHGGRAGGPVVFGPLHGMAQRIVAPGDHRLRRPFGDAEGRAESAASSTASLPAVAGAHIDQSAPRGEPLVNQLYGGRDGRCGGGDSVGGAASRPP